MKKIAIVTLVIVMAFAVPGFSMPGTLDRAIDNTMKSDIGPVADSGRILDVTNRGITKTYDAVTGPMKPVLDPVRKVRHETVSGAKRIVNFTWDMLTLKHFREHK